MQAGDNGGPFGQLSSVSVVTAPTSPTDPQQSNNGDVNSNGTVTSSAENSPLPQVAHTSRHRRRHRHRRKRLNNDSVNLPLSTTSTSPGESVTPPSTIENTVSHTKALCSTSSTQPILPNQPPRRRRRGRRRPSAPNIVTLNHHIFTRGEWRKARLADHPRAKLSITSERAPSQSTSVDGLADSGAQSNVWGLSQYLASGRKLKDLLKVQLSLNAANKSAIRIDGAFFADISGITADGKTITAKAMVYVSRDVSGFYLSYSTMVDLGMLAKDFPTPGCALTPPQPNVAQIREIKDDTPLHSPLNLHVVTVAVWNRSRTDHLRCPLTAQKRTMQK